MISWIQNHLIRHGRWIFITLLIVVIVAFVFTIGNMPGLAPKRDAYEAREYYGYDLNSQREMSVVTDMVLLSAEINARPLRNQEQLQSEVMTRIAMLHLADSLGVPAPAKEALGAFIREKPAFRGEDGTFSRDSYTRFIDRIAADPATPEGRVVQALEQDYRIEQVRAVLEGPGFVLPEETTLQARQNATEYELTTASLSYADFAPEIAVDEEALRSFFEANAMRYEIPERIEANYVFFPASDYLDAVEAPAEKELRAHFIANRERFVAAHEAAEEEPAEAEDEATPPAVTFEDVRDAVESDYREELAKRQANIAAQSFAYGLYRDEIKRDSPALTKLLDSSGLETIAIPPFSAQARNIGGLPDAMLQAAFALSTDRYYSDAFEMGSGFGVLLYKGRIEPEIPAFETVEAEVRADYLAEEKRRLFNEKGEALRESITASLDDESTFEAVAEEAGLKVKRYDAFTRTTPPTELNPSVLQQAENLAEGELSPMLRIGAEGVFVFVAGKTVPEVDEESEGYQQARTFLSRYSSFISSRALLNELVTKGIPEGTL